MSNNNNQQGGGSGGAPSFSDQELGQVVGTLQSMFDGNQNSRRGAYETFEKMKTDPRFSSMLCTIFGAPSGQVNTMTRQLAGLTLKNIMENARAKLGERVFYEAGKVALDAIKDLGDKVIAKTAASILSKITSVTGLDWWKAQFNLDLGPFVIDGLLKSDNDDRSYLGILCLQYLVEDASHQLGQACAIIINSLSNYAIEKNSQQHLADRALATLCNIYDFGAKLDWSVERLSPIQQGLQNGADEALKCGLGYFNQANIMDQRGRLETRRLCLRILYQLIPFFLEPSDENHGKCYSIAEVACKVFTSGILFNERETGIGAADILQELCIKSEATMNEGGPSGGVDYMMKGFPQIMEWIFKGMHISESDMRQRLANDNPKTRDRYQTSSMSKRSKQQDVAEESLDELDDVSNPTRDACYRLLESLSFTSGAAVFDFAKNFSNEKFNNSRNWSDRQVALDVLSCIYQGCSQHMESFIINLSDELVNICDPQNSSQNHVAVIAMSIHCLGKFWTDFVRLNNTNLAHGSFSKILLMMEHPESKYVQFAAVTAAKMIVNNSLVIQQQDMLKVHHTQLCNVVAHGLKNYNTTNMILLCDFAPYIIHILDEQQYVFYIELFMTVAEERHQELVGTLGARYFEGHGQQDVHKEYFDVMRAVTDCWKVRFVPDKDGPRCAHSLKTLIALAGNLLSSFTPIEDDPELIDYPLSLFRSFISILQTNKNVLCEIISSTKLPSLVLTVFKRCNDFHIRSFALATCHDIIIFEPTLFSHDDLNSLHIAINDVFANDNPNQDVCMFQGLQADAALALYAMSLIPADQMPFSIAAAKPSVAQVVRGDLTEESAAMGTISHCSGIFMDQDPRAFKPDEAHQVICALRYAAKDYYGALAYKGVCNFVAQLAGANRQQAQPLLNDLANLIVSWSNFVHNYDFVYDAVRNVLGVCDPVLPQMVPPAALRHYK